MLDNKRPNKEPLTDNFLNELNIKFVFTACFLLFKLSKLIKELVKLNHRIHY